jgi:hypothetical protein
MTRESVCEETANAIRDGTFALIMPVITSTRPLRREHEVDADRARLLASRMIESSTSCG